MEYNIYVEVAYSGFVFLGQTSVNLETAGRLRHSPRNQIDGFLFGVKMKTCSKCKKEYPATLEYFSKNVMGKMGLSSQCKCCLNQTRRLLPKELLKTYYENKQKALKENPERKKARMDYKKKYEKERPEWLKNIKRLYYERHKDEIINKAKEYRKNTPGYSKLSHEKNAEKKSNRRARKLAAGGTFTKKDIDNKMVQQEGKCFYCAKILGLYHVDHFIPLAKGGSNAAENIVIACPSCNLRKGDLMPNIFIELAK